MLAKIRSFLDLIKFEHTIFALPFAYLGSFLAAGGFPSLAQLFWITMAMASARTMAMALNRLIDKAIDARNPRTAHRPLITGAVSTCTAWAGVIFSALLLLFSAGMLGTLPLLLSPVAVIFLVGYSFTKRFTILSHFILGFTDGLAPVGGWVAVRGSLFTLADLPAWLLLLFVTLWIGGFDIIYACQDAEFDRREGLHAIPACYGIRTALRLSALSHALALLTLVLLGALAALPYPYWIGVAVTAGLLGWEHAVVKPDDLSHMDLAFFNINGYISVVLFAALLAAVLM